jgi:hypothetical protein
LRHPWLYRIGCGCRRRRFSSQVARGLRRRSVRLLIFHIGDNDCPASRRLRESRSACARRSCWASRIIPSRRCLHTFTSIIRAHSAPSLPGNSAGPLVHSSPNISVVRISLTRCPRWCTADVRRSLTLLSSAPCPEHLAYLRSKYRADERTRTADLLQLRVIGRGLQRFAICL